MRSIEEVIRKLERQQEELKRQQEGIGQQIKTLEAANQIMRQESETALPVHAPPTHDSTQPLMTQVPINPPIGKGWP